MLKIISKHVRDQLSGYGQSRTQSPRASWSAGGARRDSGVMGKNVIF